jgi:hypothetical protein
MLQAARTLGASKGLRMSFAIAAPALAVGLFLTMLLLLEVGRRFGQRRLARDPIGSGAGAVEGAVFGLLGLMIAFTFSGASSRFDGRRTLVVEEANNIGTAWLRIDLLRTEAQEPLRELFRRYLDSRLDTYRKASNVEMAMEEYGRSTKLQNEIWAHAVAACRDAPSPQATMLLLPALNQMIDITTTRLMATRTHPPAMVFVLLVALALAGALLAGFAMAEAKTRSWVHMLAFAAILATTVWLTIDLEYPRLGLIRVDAVDAVLVDLRRSMD